MDLRGVRGVLGQTLNQELSKRRADVLPLEGQLDRGLQVVQLVADVETTFAERPAVHGFVFASVLMASVSWISPPRPGLVSARTSKMPGPKTYLPITARLDGASCSCAGFSTRSSTLTMFPREAVTAAQPYEEMSSGGTSFNATTLWP